jgi:Uma2 family endonuclease
MPVALSRKFSADDFEAFCAENPSLRVELSAHGRISTMPPVGGESSYRSAEVACQLHFWAKQAKSGKAFDSSAAFVLPSGAVLCADTSWVSNQKIQSLAPAQRRRFAQITPDFVVEVRSPSDRRPALELKMAEWIASGVPLAWLIDGDAKTVTIYRPTVPPQTLSGIQELAADGVTEGFVLDLTDIWAGL